MVLHSIRAKWINTLQTDLRDFPVKKVIWSRFTQRLIVGFIFTDEDFKRTARNNSFPRTQDFTQSVQRQVQKLIERKDAHNMPVSQDWNNISFVKNYVAEKSRTRIEQDESPTCPQILHGVLESQIQIHPTIGQPMRTRYGTNTDLTKN